MRFIDLNADLGEGGSEDEILIGLATSVNIACGGHAGDEATMRRTLETAAKADVAIGAHPGYEDPEHFGRRAMVMPLEEVTGLMERQVGKLAAMASETGVTLHHVKPHGALYNQADKDAALATALVEGITRISRDLVLYAPPGGKLAAAGEAAGLTVHTEGFADRGYREDGSLMPRGEPGAVLSKVDEALAQALEIALRQRVLCQTGNFLPLEIDTLCIHGDGTSAVPILRALREALENSGLSVGRQARN